MSGCVVSYDASKSSIGHSFVCTNWAGRWPSMHAGLGGRVEGTHLLGHGPNHFTMYKRNVQIVPSQVMRERTNSEHS